MRGDAPVRFGGRAEESDEPKDRHRASARPIAWRGQAGYLADSLAKGGRVMVTGRLRQRSWDPRGREAVGGRDRGR
jgi:single-stranded DNA-binding protein